MFKQIMVSFLLMATLSMWSGIAQATLKNFMGTWKNNNSKTTGITEIKITKIGITANIHTWGKCYPKNCNWGFVKAIALGPNIKSGNVTTLKAVYRPSFAIKRLTVKRKGRYLIVNITTKFIDGSGRKSIKQRYIFKKKRR